MLENLKRMIREDSQPTSVMEAAAERLIDDDSDIRDAFLIDKDGVSIGANLPLPSSLEDASITLIRYSSV